VEVDFIVRSGQALIAIEVKSARKPAARSGLAAFGDSFKPQRKLIGGGDGVALESFLSRPLEFWTRPSTHHNAPA
jgi:uncharacterized protein